MSTRHLLALRARELSGKGLGWSYYLSRAAGGAIVLFAVIACGAIVHAYAAVSYAPSAALYPLRRSMEQLHAGDAAASRASDAAWRAERRLREFDETDDHVTKRSLLRDAEMEFSRMDDAAAALPAEEADAVRIERFALEERAILTFAAWRDALQAAPEDALPIRQTASTHTADPEMVLPASDAAAGPFAMEMGGTPGNAAPALETLLRNSAGYGENLRAILPRLDRCASAEHPFADAATVDAYIRFLLGADAS